MTQITEKLKLYPWKVYWRIFIWIAVIWVAVSLLFMSLPDFPLVCESSGNPFEFCGSDSEMAWIGAIMLFWTLFAVPLLSGYIFLILKLFPQNTDADNVRMWKRVSIYILLAPIGLFLMGYIISFFF